MSPLLRPLLLALVALAALLAPATASSQAAPQGSPGAGSEAPGADAYGTVEGRILEIIERADGERVALVGLGDGSVVEALLPGDDPFAPAGLPEFRAGERVETYFSPAPGTDRAYVVSDWVRRPALLGLTALFLIVSVAVARFKGLRAFVATGTGLAIVVAYIVPRIVAGDSPVVVSLVGVGGILILAIYFVHGVSWSTTAALIGTFVAVLATMALGIVFSDLARLTGYGTEEAMLINAGAAGAVNLRGLTLAGLLVGALGALTDITIVQASVVRELAHTDPALRSTDLYARAMNVGLDHIGSLVNTLVLAYTGSALPLMVLLLMNDVGLARALNLELVAGEIVHTLVGAIGLILAVPLTTLIAAWMFQGDRLALRPGELEHAHHH